MGRFIFTGKGKGDILLRTLANRQTGENKRAESCSVIKAHGNKVHREKEHEEAVYGKASLGETTCGEIVHGEIICGKIEHGEVVYGETDHEETDHGEMICGETGRGKTGAGRIFGKRVWCTMPVRRVAAFFFCAFLAIFSLAACGDENSAKVIFTTGLDKDEVFRIGDEVCTVPEMMVYLTNTQNQYESVYSAEVWNISVEGVTLEENVKETVLAKIAQIKTMHQLARDRGVALDEAEREKVELACAEYFGSLNETEILLMGVEEKTIEGLYEEYALADKIYRYIIQDVNPEISDDEARTITVQHILFRTSTVDGAGNVAEYSQERRQETYQNACEIRRQAVEEEQDFVDLATRYSEDATISFSFGKGEMDAAFEEAAFALETGEVSQVVETQAGYEIIKCLSTFDREQTDLNKLQIVEERRREVFGQEYDAFVEPLARQLNEKVWEEITLLRDEAVETKSFFDVYAKYFPE